jgi:alanyl-tRNA synthetase
VRRIEALTGPAAIDYFRERDRDLASAGSLLGSPDDPVAAAKRASERLAELEKESKQAGSEDLGKHADEIAAAGQRIGEITVFIGRGHGADQRSLLDLADRIKSRAGDAAVVLGGAEDGKVALVASFSESAVEKGLSAADIIKGAAKLVGGGGGGRENVAQAGGRDPEKLDDALAAARDAIEAKLGA